MIFLFKAKAVSAFVATEGQITVAALSLSPSPFLSLYLSLISFSFTWFYCCPRFFFLCLLFSLLYSFYPNWDTVNDISFATEAAQVFLHRTMLEESLNHWNFNFEKYFDFYSKLKEAYLGASEWMKRKYKSS